jgi:cbb3-type cytochrome oxidase subunit 3
MVGGFASALVAALAFGITFGIVRWVTNRRRKQRMAQAERSAMQGRSRQVRRAQERRNK